MISLEENSKKADGAENDYASITLKRFLFFLLSLILISFKMLKNRNQKPKSKNLLAWLINQDKIC